MYRVDVVNTLVPNPIIKKFRIDNGTIDEIFYLISGIKSTLPQNIVDWLGNNQANSHESLVSFVDGSIDYFYPAWDFPIWEEENNPIASIQTNSDLLRASNSFMVKMAADLSGPHGVYYYCQRDGSVIQNLSFIRNYFEKINKISLYNTLESYVYQLNFSNHLVLHKKEDETHWAYVLCRD
jgi:hypothetical protein